MSLLQELDSLIDNYEVYISKEKKLMISTDLDVDKLTNNEIILAHSLVHLLSSVKNKHFTFEQLKQIHDRIKTRFPNHKYFDRLDKNE